MGTSRPYKNVLTNLTVVISHTNKVSCSQPMTFLYCFNNASLTQRMLFYLQQKMRWHLKITTTIFSNEVWIIRLILAPSLGDTLRGNCEAMLNEYGVPYQASPMIARVLEDLDSGASPVEVMNRYRVSILSHGAPAPDEIECFRARFISGLGYCPEALG